MSKFLSSILDKISKEPKKPCVLPRVTVGVLQATLALEEEVSLKAQLQKLLTVAKNLFSHLGGYQD